MRRERSNSAFTLIELLVVVAILSLLMAILAPSLGRARQQAKRVYCLNNVRSIWTGILTYSLSSKDHVPFMEDINTASPDYPETGPAADPFDERYPTTVGVVMLAYVSPETWVCPNAVAGFPQPGPWRMTYTLGVGPRGIGQVIPWDRFGGDRTGGSGANLTNYWPFDGRPIEFLDGRRYVRSVGLNTNDKGTWSARFPLIADMIVDEAAPAIGGFVYPHKGQLDRRNDLENARDAFERNVNWAGGGALTGRHELHADGEQAHVFLTRLGWTRHQPGY